MSSVDGGFVRKGSLRNMFKTRKRKDSFDASSLPGGGGGAAAANPKKIDDAATDCSSSGPGRWLRSGYDGGGGDGSDSETKKGPMIFRCFARPTRQGSDVDCCRLRPSFSKTMGAKPSKSDDLDDDDFSMRRTTHTLPGERTDDDDEDADDSEEFYSVDGDHADEAVFNNAIYAATTTAGAVFTSECRPQIAVVEAAAAEAVAVSKEACECAQPCHYSLADPSFPLFTPPGLSRGGYEEMLYLAKACVGHWITILERSESIDAHYRALGIGMFKRKVMNCLAVPMTQFLEEEDSILHNWIHTPLGIRHMRCDLHGKDIEDSDPDAGVWVGSASVVDYPIPSFCSRPVRAIQQRRVSPKVGLSIETRAILPDKEEGKICFYNFSMETKKGDKISTNRILRWVSETAPAS